MTTTTTPLSTEERNAIGHAAAALGSAAANTARAFLRIKGLSGPADIAHLTDRLADYRLCCELAGCAPNQPWVEAIEAAIALPEREG